MGCQKEIASQIIAQKADYVLALKGNQGKLYDEVSYWFEKARTHNFEGIEHSYHQATESAHGRIEIRQYWSVPVCQLGELPNQQQWSGLTSVGMVVCERRLWNKTTIEVRFYISSLEHDALVLANAVRSHWGIENSVHWSLRFAPAFQKAGARRSDLMSHLMKMPVASVKTMPHLIFLFYGVYL
jgi:predicted transposase YbfD/YdcC